MYFYRRYIQSYVCGYGIFVKAKGASSIYALSVCPFVCLWLLYSTDVEAAVIATLDSLLLQALVTPREICGCSGLNYRRTMPVFLKSARASELLPLLLFLAIIRLKIRRLIKCSKWTDRTNYNWSELKENTYPGVLSSPGCN